MVVWVSTRMFKNLGHADGEITLAVGSITLVWSLKPLWAAFLDTYRTKKFIVLAMELLLALLFGVAALALQVPQYFAIIAAVLWVAAFSSATQDICVDGVYITSLNKKQMAGWAGVQGVFWNVGRIFAQAAVVWIAGTLIDRGVGGRTAWMYALAMAAASMAALLIYHRFVLPTGSVTRESRQEIEAVPTSPGLRAGVAIGAGVALGAVTVFTSGRIIGALVGMTTTALILAGWRRHVPTFLSFIRKPSIWGMMLFIFLYRTGEGFLLVEGPLFMQAPVEQGGLGLTLQQMAGIDGLVSTSVSLLAGLLGGAFIARIGLKRALLPLALCMNIPHLCYVILSQAAGGGHGLSLLTILTLVTVEKFGYSFGMVGNMVYMMTQVAPGKYKMTHYAYATALMNLVLWPTQTASGPLADWMGYRTYFLFVMVASIPSVLAAWRAPFPDPVDVADESEDEAAAAVPSAPEPRPAVQATPGA
jgi:PAT family beta-lactamase induction signal transducer AmpG